MKKGFSLIEVLILSFIGISILILIIGVISNSREFARTMGCVNNIKSIAQAIENYQADFKETPVTLNSLIPAYIQNSNVFHCPSDREKRDSYSDYYIGRFFAEEDTNKVFLVCPRHFRGRRVVLGYLSYAVDIGKTKPVNWSGLNTEFGKTYSGGILNFEDGTKVEIYSGKVGVLGSFTDTEDKIYSIIYVPEGENTTFEVDHKTNSRFEIITPAVIAGVEGTKFKVDNEYKNDSGIPLDKTVISVFEGNIEVMERNQGRREKIQANEWIMIETRTYEENKKGVPRKPPKVKPHIIKKIVNNS
ncbi:MAG: DUF1559 domain-containing protein [Candidatus Omnitrophica bacterium]|nr:DUF1559 domain-containing protein [Candidatus Omnitrophota bacterium]MCM8802784.1 DUF1559 domain-containing protein [Candidatus Omnitrophota bacterium]